MFLLSSKQLDHTYGSPIYRNIIYVKTNHGTAYIYTKYNKWIEVSDCTEAIRFFALFNAVEASECDKDKYIELAKKEITDLRDVGFMDVYIDTDPKRYINSTGIANYTKHI